MGETKVRPGPSHNRLCNFIVQHAVVRRRKTTTHHAGRMKSIVLLIALLLLVFEDVAASGKKVVKKAASKQVVTETYTTQTEEGGTFEEEGEEAPPVAKPATRPKKVVKKAVKVVKKKETKAKDPALDESDDLRRRMAGASLAAGQGIASSQYDGPSSGADKRPSVLYPRPTGVSIGGFGSLLQASSMPRPDGRKQRASQSSIASPMYDSGFQGLGGSPEEPSQTGIASAKFGQKATQASIRSTSYDDTRKPKGKRVQKEAVRATIRDASYDAEKPKSGGRTSKTPAKAISIREKSFDKEAPASYYSGPGPFSKDRRSSSTRARPGVAVAHDLSASKGHPRSSMSTAGTGGQRSAFAPAEIPDEKSRGGKDKAKYVIRLKERDIGQWIPITYKPIPGVYSDDVIMVETATQPMRVEIIDASSQGHKLVVENAQMPIVYSRPSTINKRHLEQPLAAYDIALDNDLLGYGRGFVDPGSLVFKIYVDGQSTGVEFDYSAILHAFIRVQPIELLEIPDTNYSLITTPFFSTDANDVAKLFNLRLAHLPSSANVRRICAFIRELRPKIQNEYVAMFLAPDDPRRRYDDDDNDKDALVLKWAEKTKVEQLRVRDHDVYMILAEPKK